MIFLFFEEIKLVGVEITKEILGFFDSLQVKEMIFIVSLIVEKLAKPRKDSEQKLIKMNLLEKLKQNPRTEETTKAGD